MKGIIVDWIDTLASIPSDWLLCDGNNSTPNMLGKYPLGAGAGEDPGATGGSTTHTHSSTAHTHTQDAHSHTGDTGVNEYWLVSSAYSLSVSHGNHYHSYTTNTTVATNQTTTVTTDSVSNDPAYYKVAPIIDNSVAGVKYPVNSLILWDRETLPLFWEQHTESINKFLKYVDASENPGATGGSATHTHTPNSHNHTQDGHTHNGTTGAPTTINYVFAGEISNAAASDNHTHNISAASTVAVNQSANITLDTVNGEPTFKKLLILKNTGIANRPKYAIVKWSGTIANIPLGYVLCDGNNGTTDLRGYFEKGALDSSEIGNTGGSSVHAHTASSHNHTQNSHIHVVSSSGNAAYSYATGGTTRYYALWNHDHPSANSNSTTATNQATTITVSNCSSQANYPPYYKVAYIMQDRDLDVGAYAFMIN